MDKPPASGTKRKGNKVMGKLFRRKSRESEEAEKVEDGKDQATKSRNDMDEETWRRIKNMEQTRQISAMKNHIEKLETKLEAMQSPNNNTGLISQSPIVEDKLENKRKHKGGFTRKSQKKQNNVVGDENLANRPTTGKDKMLKNLFQRSFKKSGKKSEGSVQEDFVFAENDGDVALDGKNAEKASKKDHQERGEGSTSERKSKRYFRRKNNNSKDRSDDQHLEEKNVGAIFEDRPEKEEGTIYVEIHDKENPCQEGLFKDEIQDNPDLELHDQAEFEHLEAALQESDAVIESDKGSNNLTEMKEDLRVSCEKLLIEVTRNLVAESCESEPKIESIGSANQIDGMRIEENADHGRISQSLETDYTDLKSVTDGEEIPKQIESDSISQSNLKDYEKTNSDLKEKVSELEEQLWLAAEERRNMQAMLALQKEKALKNLAFKFEEINRKTLREFRGIFECKLQEINDEKVKLEEKLLKYEKEKEFVVIGCEKCDILKRELTESENRSEKLSSENATLKRRCRKLSGDLGKVKNVVGAANASVDIVSSEIGTQTDFSGNDLQTIGVQTEDSVETSLKDIHLDVKNIADKVSVLSSNISASPRSWSEFSGEDQSFGSDSLPSSSPKNLATTDEKIRRDSDDNSLQSPPPADISLGPSKRVVDEEILESPAVSRTEGSDEVDNLPNRSDDGDSGIFGSDLSQLSEYNIEKQLHKIHEKYTKISEELENYADSRLKGALENDGYVVAGRIKQTGLDPEIQKIVDDVNRKYETGLDPEIQKIVDDVNRKYEEYFKTKLML